MSERIDFLERPQRDLGAEELWRRSLARSRDRRALAAAGIRGRRSLISAGLADLDAPAEFRRLPASTQRDLSEHEIWDMSLACARAKRLAAEKGLLQQARAASAPLVVAAVAGLAAAQGSAHPRSGRAETAQTDRKLLEFGSRGAAVKSVQRALRIPADGIFGPQTRRAVRRFQAAHGLAVDGIVGPKTRAALFGQGHAGSLIRAWWVVPVQRALGVSVDGLYGPQTRAAVRRFQATHGLAVDGIVGPKTRAALFGHGHAGSLIRAWWVVPVQRALGVPVDGLYGPQTRAAVRAYQARNGLIIDGIVGPQTLSHLGISRSASGHRRQGGGTDGSGTGGASGPASISRSLWDELRLARRMGLRLVSGYRPGATIAGGRRSDHSYYPSRAIDVAGSRAAMRSYARAVAGRTRIKYVIYSPLGMWGNWNGSWSPVSGATRADHYSHVHVSATR